MTRANYQRLRRGLEEALAHVEGKPSTLRLTSVAVPAVDVRAIRAKLGVTQPIMAGLLGVSTSGYRKWEQGQRRPSGAALTLLRVADADPEAVLRVLQSA
jgi:putative transcriptional regulator